MQCSDLMNYIGCLEITRHDLFTYTNHITIRLGAKTKPSSLASGLKQKPKWVPQQLSTEVMFQNPHISLRGKLEGRMFYDDNHQSISFPLVNAAYTSRSQERKMGATFQTECDARTVQIQDNDWRFQHSCVGSESLTTGSDSICEF